MEMACPEFLFRKLALYPKTSRCMKFLFALLLSGLSFVLSAQMLTFDSLDLVKSEVIYFDFGRYEIRPEAVSTLRAFAALTMG